MPQPIRRRAGTRRAGWSPRRRTRCARPAQTPAIILPCRDRYQGRLSARDAAADDAAAVAALHRLGADLLGAVGTAFGHRISHVTPRRRRRPGAPRAAGSRRRSRRAAARAARRSCRRGSSSTPRGRACAASRTRRADHERVRDRAPAASGTSAAATARAERRQSSRRAWRASSGSAAREHGGRRVPAAPRRTPACERGREPAELARDAGDTRRSARGAPPVARRAVRPRKSASRSSSQSITMPPPARSRARASSVRIAWCRRLFTVPVGHADDRRHLGLGHVVIVAQDRAPCAAPREARRAGGAASMPASAVVGPRAVSPAIVASAAGSRGSGRRRRCSSRARLSAIWKSQVEKRRVAVEARRRAHHVEPGLLVEIVGISVRPCSARGSDRAAARSGGRAPRAPTRRRSATRAMRSSSLAMPLRRQALSSARSGRYVGHRVVVATGPLGRARGGGDDCRQDATSARTCAVPRSSKESSPGSNGMISHNAR